MHKEEKMQKIAVRGQGSAHSVLEKQLMSSGNKKKTSEDNRLRILFFHNTLPEYRIGWFNELSKIADVEFVFTNESLNKKNYRFDIDYERSACLKCVFLTAGKQGEIQLNSILDKIAEFDFVELPPMDSWREVVCGRKIIRACKKNNVKIGYFWEKWEAPKDKQPTKRKVKNLILRIVPKVIYKNADIIFAVGRKSKEYFISNGIDKNKIVIIPDASETPICEYEDIRVKYGIPIDKKNIMFLGRLMPQKGVQCLIKAFAELKPNIQEKCHLLIVGDGEDKETCEKLVEDLEITNVTFTGAVNPKIRRNYFAQCDVFVYPVNYITGWVDVWGLTVNEAVQNGKIVIATDAVGSAYELIEEGVNGFRVEPDNVEKLKEALEKAFNDSMKETARKKDAEIMETFNFHEMAKRYVKFISDVI